MFMPKAFTLPVLLALIASGGDSVGSPLPVCVPGPKPLASSETPSIPCQSTRESPQSNWADMPVETSATSESRLYEAIMARIGLPYLLGGTDDLGYDCSGFIWRVFLEAGIDLPRRSVREMWERLPAIEEGQEGEFGVIVFFSGLTHAGIVRDAHSFYHASSSQGIVRSFFSDYWGARVTGYRRVPLSRLGATRPRWSRQRSTTTPPSRQPSPRGSTDRDRP